jgi:demethylmenaquinone methyltransferase/2-methoxy-6-polyprenyl-1,4-benzoquinol methylase
MDKHTLISFFDRAASEWDARMVTDERKIEYILDRAGVCTGSMVLDVACGTGVLFPYYLRRNPARVIAVDISPEMARIAAQKAEGTVIEVLCGDIETLSPETLCDCCVVYNAFPHFEDPSNLVACLARWVRPGGRITVAHSMSLDALHRHHAGRAEHVSRPMLSSQGLTKLLSPWFAVDTAVSDEEKYVVSGVRLA